MTHLLPVLRIRLVCLLVSVAAAVVPGAVSALTATQDRVSSEVSGAGQFLAELAEAERKHDYRAILAECDRVVKNHPDEHEAYRRRGLARWGARKYDGALADFDKAVELAKAHKASPRTLVVLYYGRALVHREQHDAKAEAAELELATKTDRGFTDAFNDLAWIRATNPEAGLRDGAESLRLAQHACEVLPSSVKYLDTLAAAYAEAGEAKKAADAERAAIKAAGADARTAEEHKDFLSEAPRRVEFYAGGGKYRDDRQ